MTKPVLRLLALLLLSLPALLLAAPDSPSNNIDISHGSGEPSRTPPSVIKSLKTRAELFGIGDSVSTYLAIQNRSVHERNPLVNTSPAGLVGLAATKILLLEIFDARLSASDKKTLYPLASALYASGTFNNLLLAASASNPIALAGGIAAGVYTHQTQTAYARQDDLKVYCSAGSNLRDCTSEYAPQYAVRLP